MYRIQTEVKVWLSGKIIVLNDVNDMQRYMLSWHVCMDKLMLSQQFKSGKIPLEKIYEKNMLRIKKYVYNSQEVI